MLPIQISAQKSAFLQALAGLGNLKRASENTGINLGNHYNWLRDDPQYQTAFEIAAAEASEMLEAEAFRRGHDGVDKPIFYQGEQCGVVREYSDSLLTLLLKARKPSVFGDKIRQEITGKDGAPLNGVDLSRLSDDELAALETLLRKATPTNGTTDNNPGTPGSGAVTAALE